jgi:hypothetical protein
MGTVGLTHRKCKINELYFSTFHLPGRIPDSIGPLVTMETRRRVPPLFDLHGDLWAFPGPLAQDT